MCGRSHRTRLGSLRRKGRGRKPSGVVQGSIASPRQAQLPSRLSHTAWRLRGRRASDRPARGTADAPGTARARPSSRRKTEPLSPSPLAQPSRRRTKMKLAAAMSDVQLSRRCSAAVLGGSGPMQSSAQGRQSAPKWAAAHIRVRRRASRRQAVPCCWRTLTLRMPSCVRSAGSVRTPRSGMLSGVGTI